MKKLTVQQIKITQESKVESIHLPFQASNISWALFKGEEVFAQNISALEEQISKQLMQFKDLNLPEQPVYKKSAFQELEGLFLNLLKTCNYLEQEDCFLASQQVQQQLPEFKSTIAQLEQILDRSLEWQSIQEQIEICFAKADHCKNLLQFELIDTELIQLLETKLNEIYEMNLDILDKIDTLSFENIKTDELSQQYLKLMNDTLTLQEQLAQEKNKELFF